MKKFFKDKAVCLSSLTAFLLIGLSLVNSAFAEIPVYRFYNDTLRTHFFTIDENEKAHLEADSGWRYEGVAWHAYATQEAGTLPVYRFYSAATASHLYTMDENEKAVLMSGSAYNYEGVAYYTYANTNDSAIRSDGSVIPVYRLYSGLLMRHLLTTDINEVTVLDADDNWVWEGTAWYVRDDDDDDSDHDGDDDSDHDVDDDSDDDGDDDYDNDGISNSNDDDDDNDGISDDDDNDDDNDGISDDDDDDDDNDGISDDDDD